MDTINSNMGPSKIWTDAGPAYIKPMADDVNPHALAIELVCTRFAEWFGLDTFDTALLTLTPADAFERKPLNSAYPSRKPAKPGPAFVTRAVIAERWDGDAATLNRIENPGDIGKLVVFDTVVRNDDRYPPISEKGERISTWRSNRGNVLLVSDPPGAKSLRLVAMDFGRAMIGENDVSAKRLQGEVRSDPIYGLFPEFRPFVTRDIVEQAVVRLNGLCREDVDRFVAEVPREWEFGTRERNALTDHICGRARYVADTIMSRLAPLCFPQGELGF